MVFREGDPKSQPTLSTAKNRVPKPRYLTLKQNAVRNELRKHKYIYIYIYIHMHRQVMSYTYTYIYIYSERERERERYIMHIVRLRNRARCLGR